MAHAPRSEENIDDFFCESGRRILRRHHQTLQSPKHASLGGNNELMLLCNQSRQHSPMICLLTCLSSGKSLISVLALNTTTKHLPETNNAPRFWRGWNRILFFIHRGCLYSMPEVKIFIAQDWRDLPERWCDLPLPKKSLHPKLG